jgi:hypothetical protein
MPELDDLKTEPSRRLPVPFAGPWPEAIHWHPEHPSPGERLDPIREAWLRQYLAELLDGRWGEILELWFDSPAAAGVGDRPWEPCAITIRSDGKFLVVSEDFKASPRRLRLYAEEADYDAAYAIVHRLRPWHVSSTPPEEFMKTVVYVLDPADGRWYDEYARSRGADITLEEATEYTSSSWTVLSSEDTDQGRRTVVFRRQHSEWR